ncbi:MAG: type IV toxin-antitoxin system AbiEi family antitoxin domain-containing protein [Alteromonadaceae bacterium]|nr:type IV toxin-antitoxin system AbiEi family antitoxin domain-containing protein [Alteromonadaceae bacterium]
MKQSDAIKRLAAFDLKGRYVYSSKDISKLFPEESARSRQATITRLVKSGILERPSKGVYVYALSRHQGPDILEHVAKTLRRGEYNYISLESALSEYGVISQVPVGRITVITTGRKGEYKTPYGVIEFTHTKRSVADILSGVQDRGHPLRIATKAAALRDLKRTGRNTHLIDPEEARA